MADNKELILISTGSVRHIYIHSAEGYLYNKNGQVRFGVLNRGDLRFQFDLLTYSGYTICNGEPTKANVCLIRHTQDVPVGFPPLFLCANPDYTVTLKEAPFSMMSLTDGDRIQLPVNPSNDTEFRLDEALFISTNVNETNILQWNTFVFLESFVYKEYYVSSKSQDQSLSLEKCLEHELPFKNNLKFDLMEVLN